MTERLDNIPEDESRLDTPTGRSAKDVWKARGPTREPMAATATWERESVGSDTAAAWNKSSNSPWYQTIKKKTAQTGFELHRQPRGKQIALFLYTSAAAGAERQIAGSTGKRAEGLNRAHALGPDSCKHRISAPLFQQKPDRCRKINYKAQFGLAYRDARAIHIRRQ